MKNNTRNMLGMLGKWLLVALFISAAPFANAQDRTLSIGSITYTDGAAKAGETFKLTYSAANGGTDQKWDGIKLAVVIKAVVDNNGTVKYEVLKNLSEIAIGTNTEINDIKLPSAPWWYEDFDDPDNSKFLNANNYSIGIVPYKGSSLILKDEIINITNDDFIEVQGATEALSYYYNSEGVRRATTKPFDLTNPNNKATLKFYFGGVNLIKSESTLPQLLASTDGGITFKPVPVQQGDAEYRDLGLLSSPYTTYSVEVDQLTSKSVQFRWEQKVHGENDIWYIGDISIVIGGQNVAEANGTNGNNIFFTNQTISFPSFNNYTWSLVKKKVELKDVEPTIYNGSSKIEFNWGLLSDTYQPFIGGTKIEFFLWKDDDYVTDPATGDTIKLGSSTDKIFTIPFLTKRGAYQVRGKATLNGKEVCVGKNLATLNIFTNTIKASIINPNQITFAGSKVEVKGALTNEATAPTDLWYNLILIEGSNEWLLDAKKGLNTNLVANLHPSITGNRVLRIEASMNNPMGVVGVPIEKSSLAILGDETDISNATFVNPIFKLQSTGQKSQIQTNGESKSWDLSNMGTANFSVMFNKELTELTDEQKMVFEYSVDGGVTFTSIASYPDARFEKDIYVDESIELPKAAQTEKTILRWRVEVINATVSIKGIELKSLENYKKAPLIGVNEALYIAEQRIDLTPNQQTACPDGTIEFTYNIRGRFSEESTLTIKSLGNTLKIDAKDIKFTGITNGTGEISLNLGLLDNPISGNDVKFRLEAKDFEFDKETSFSVTGLWTELGVEIIPNIEDFTPNIYAQTSGNTEYYSCNDEERIVVLTSVKEYFAYQLRNVNTGELIGDKIFVDSEDEILTDSDTYPYYNTGDNSLKISIGAISEHTVVEVIVTSHNAENSLTCQTYVPNGQAAFNTRDLAIQYKWTGSEIGAGYWKDVTGNENFTICEGSTNLSFRLYDYAEVNPVSAGITWYRNNTETPVVVGATLNNYPATGEYFVVYKHNKCSDYASDSIQITVAEIPTKPIITFEGSQEICEGESATLSTSDNYSYYKWYRFGIEIINATSNTIEVYEDGSYTVEVSNREFDPNVSVCSSISDAYSVSLNVHIKPVTPDSFTLIDGVLCEPGAAQVNLGFFENDVRYQLYDWQTKKPTGKAVLAGNQSSVILTSDVLTKNTKLGVIATRNNEQMCGSVYSTSFAEVSVHDLYIDVNGNTLIASIKEADASTYQWYRNDKIINYGGDSRTLNIYDDAKYKVVVETTDGCLLESTIGKGSAKEEVKEVTATTLSLFPNPASDIITINFANADDETVRIRILNISGEVVFDKEVVKADSELRYAIPISKFNNGAYIVHVIGKQEVKVQQFIKF